MFDTAWVLAEDHALHVLDAAGDRAVAFERGFAPAVEAGLVGFYFDEDEDAVAAVGEDGF